MPIMRMVPLLLLAVPAAASAQTMNADTFYKRSSALMARGPAAMFAMREIKSLTGEAKRAGEAVRATRLADEAAGRPARYCPPKGKHMMGSSEFMHRLGAIPAMERRRIDMTEAMTRISATKYPCPR